MACGIVVFATIASSARAQQRREREPNSVYAARRAKLAAEVDAPIVLWGYTGRDPSSRLISEVVQSDLQKIGVTVNLRLWEYSQLGTAIWKELPKAGPAATDYDMFMLGWGTVTSDADFTLYGTISDISMPPEGLNGCFWAPKPYMDLIEKARFSTNPSAKAQPNSAQ